MDLAKVVLATISFSALQSSSSYPLSVSCRTEKFIDCSRDGILRTEREIDKNLEILDLEKIDAGEKLIHELNLFKEQVTMEEGLCERERSDMIEAAAGLKALVIFCLFDSSHYQGKKIIVNKILEERTPNDKTLEDTDKKIGEIFLDLEETMDIRQKAITEKLKVFTEQLNNTKELDCQEKRTRMENAKELQTIIQNSQKLITNLPGKTVSN